MFGEGVSFGALAGEARHRRGLGDSDFRGELIFGGARFQFLELQRQLIDQPLRSLRAGAVDRAPASRSAASDARSGQVFGALARATASSAPASRSRLGIRSARSSPAPLSARRCRPAGRARSASMPALNHKSGAVDSAKQCSFRSYPAAPAAKCDAGSASRSHRAYRPAARPRADRAVGRRRPDEAALLQPLGVKRHAKTVVPENLNQVASGAPENI